MPVTSPNSPETRAEVRPAISVPPVVPRTKSWRGFYQNRRNADNSYNKVYLQIRLFSYIRPYLWRAIVAVCLTLPIGALDAAVAYSLKPFLDGMITKTSIQTVSYAPLMIVGFTAIQGLLNYFSVYLNGWLGLKVVNDIRHDLFVKLQSMDVKYFDQNSSGAIIQGYFNDPGVLQKNLLETFKQFLTRLFSTLSLMTVLMLTSWKLALIAIGVTVCIMYPSTRLNKIIKSLNRVMISTSTNLLSIYTETVQGIAVVKGYNLTHFRQKQFDQLQRAMFDFSIKLTKTQGWLTPSMHIIAAIGVATVIWAGSQMVINDELTPGALLSFIAALVMMYNPLKNLGNTFMSTLVSLLAAGRVFDILDTQTEVHDKPDAIALPTLSQSIEFDTVHFEYIPEQPVLKGISLRIQKGETIALVGGSGGGKSTIARLIPRFYDVTQGAVRIDGHDLRDVTIDSLRSQIALVMQDNFLFDGSIKDNVMMGNFHASPEALQDALEKAYLSDFIASLPEGLDTGVGERGSKLSGGQRQRVAIARAILKDTPIVILDEATSALDNQSEAIVQKAMDSLMVNKTVIIIAHRLSTIKNADRIFVIDGGQVLESGSHDELLERDAAYAMLYKTQFSSQQLRQAAAKKAETDLISEACEPPHESDQPTVETAAAVG